MIKRILVLALTFIAFGSVGTRAADSINIGDVKFTGIKSIQVVDGAIRRAIINVEISNSSGSEIRIFGDGQYSFKFKKDEAKPILLPNAMAKEVVLPKGSMMSAGKGIMSFEVVLGEASEVTTREVLIPLFNLMSSASEEKNVGKLQIEIEGNVNFGVRSGSAIVKETRNILWPLTPKVNPMVFAN